jgi:hypothetical protein
MDTDKCSPVDRVAPPQPKAQPKKDRGEDLPAEMKDWIIRTTRIHAHLCYLVRLFKNPSMAGGQSLEGETFAARAARGDRTLLYDALGLARDEIDAMREEIQKKMDSAPGTRHPPGSAGKVAEMFARAEAGFSIFIDDDAPMGSPEIEI